MKSELSLGLVMLVSFLCLNGCGSSAGTNSGKEKTSGEKVEETPPVTEIFDMSPYHSTFNFDLPKPSGREYEIWYGYDTSSAEVESQIVEVPGYRVEVLVTDDLEEANSMKADLYLELKQDSYVIFDAPYYKVRTGDYESRSAAENLSFKLKQLGFADSRVVSDTIKKAERK